MKLTLKPQHTTDLSQCHWHLKAFLVLVSDKAQHHEHQLILNSSYQNTLSCATPCNLTFSCSCHPGARTDPDHNALLQRAVAVLLCGPWIGCVGQHWWLAVTGLAFSKLHHLTPAPCAWRPTARIFMAKYEATSKTQPLLLSDVENLRGKVSLSFKTLSMESWHSVQHFSKEKKKLNWFCYSVTDTEGH